jgi:hypothetical protein
MKKTIFTKTLSALVILALFATTSCKKDGSNPSTGYYVKFKVNGEQKQYSEAAVAVFNTALPVYACAMVGEKLINGTVSEGMAISIYNDAPIAANVTYTDQEVASIGTQQATLLFTDSTGEQSSSALLPNPNVQVIITQMDDKTVTGTFSGTIESTLDYTTTKSVTEGQFHLPRQ